MCGGVRDFGEKAGRKKGEGCAHFKKHFGKVTIAINCVKRERRREARGERRRGRRDSISVGSVGLTYTTLMRL